ncbi:dihydrodipicolinate synthase family protein [Chloroflexota bacterium]
MSGNRPGGIICPIATFLNPDETLDESAQRKHLDRIVNDIDGVLVMGTTGEFALLTEEVGRRVVELTVEYINGRKPVYVGIGDTGTQRVLEKLDFIATSGVDYAVVCSPYYYTVGDDQALLYHFETIADRSKVPVLAYNIPQNTYNNIPPRVIGRLSEHPNIVGLKDSWGDMFQFQEYLAYRSESFSVFMGPEHLAAASLWLGADGVVSALANFVPDWVQQLYVQVKQGEREQSLKTQRRITELARIFEHGVVSCVLKVVLNRLGIGSERPAAPLPPCTEDQKQAIYRLLETAELI